MSARRIVSAAVAVLLGLTASLVGSSAAHATEGDGWYTIRNVHSNLYLAPRTDANGVAVWQIYESWTRPYEQPAPDLDWLMVTSGSYRSFRNADSAARYALTINGNATTTAKPAIVWTYGPTTDQQWTLVGTGSSHTYMMKNRKSGKCLAMPNASTAYGAQPIEWTCESGHEEQQWSVVDDR